MPAHYALSDAAIVLVAIWAGTMLWRKDRRLPAFAMKCFAIPAAIGVVRFGGGLQTGLAAPHACASQLLGLAGSLAFAVTTFPRVSSRNNTGLIGAILILSAASYFLAKVLIPALFILVLVIATGSSLCGTKRLALSWLVPVGFATLLANGLLIRQAPWLDAAVAWHIYHMLIALALALLAKGFCTASHMGLLPPKLNLS